MAAPPLRMWGPASGQLGRRRWAPLAAVLAAAGIGFVAAFAIARDARTHVPLRPAVMARPGPEPITSAHLTSAGALPGLKAGGAPSSVIRKLPSSVPVSGRHHSISRPAPPVTPTHPQGPTTGTGSTTGQSTTGTTSTSGPTTGTGTGSSTTGGTTGTSTGDTTGSPSTSTGTGGSTGAGNTTGASGGTTLSASP